MKKTVSTLLICSLLAVFFCSPVFGATPTAATRRTSSKSVSSVTVNVNLDQFGITSNATSSYGTYTPVIVSVQIHNNNNTPALVDSCTFSITTASASMIIGYDTFSPDLTLGYFDGTNFVILPSNEFSYGNGIVVPPKESLYLVGEIDIAGVNSSGSYVANTISAVSISNYTVGLSSEYPYGLSTDFSPIISYLANYSNGFSDLNTTVSSLNTALTNFYNRNHTDFVNTYNRLGNMLTKLTVLDDINDALTALNTSVDNIELDMDEVVRLLTYTGTVPSSGYINANTQRSAEVSDTYYVANTQITAFGSYLVNGDYEAVFPSSYYLNYTYCIPIQVYFRIVVRDDLKFNYVTIDLLDVSNSYNGTVYLNDFFSGTFTDTRIYIQNNTLKLGVFCPYTLSVGTYVFDAWINLYVMNNTTVPVFPNPINLVFDGMSQVNNSVSDEANTLTNQSNQAHTQEQQFFNQNSQAIANTGLGNYQFDINQSNGITVVTGLFNRLWNSLGSWNTVYFFSLTITVALTIIRYTTNAIKRRSYSEDKGGKP